MGFLLRKTRMIDLTTKHSIDQPIQKWEWPKETWLQNRMKSVQYMKDPTDELAGRVLRRVDRAGYRPLEA